MFTVLPQGDLAKILESNLLPKERELYETNDFDAFLKLPSHRIVNFLDEQLV